MPCRHRVPRRCIARALIKSLQHVHATPSIMMHMRTCFNNVSRLVHKECSNSTRQRTPGHVDFVICCVRAAAVTAVITIDMQKYNCTLWQGQATRSAVPCVHLTRPTASEITECMTFNDIQLVWWHTQKTRRENMHSKHSIVWTQIRFDSCCHIP